VEAPSSSRYDRVVSVEAQHRPVSSDEDDLEQAAREVDATLLHWSMGLSLRERLRAATRTARMLGRFHRAGTP
jgi:hypothetical protein